MPLILVFVHLLVVLVGFDNSLIVRRSGIVNSFLSRLIESMWNCFPTKFKFSNGGLVVCLSLQI